MVGISRVRSGVISDMPIDMFGDVSFGRRPYDSPDNSFFPHVWETTERVLTSSDDRLHVASLLLVAMPLFLVTSCS